MQLNVFIVLLLAITGCAPKAKWDKDALVNKCLKDFTKRNEKEKLLSPMQLAHVCDCLAEKMLVKYKSEKEADKDKEGMQELGSTCALEAMEKTK